MNNVKANSEPNRVDGPVIAACIVMKPSEAEYLLALFREAVASLANDAPIAECTLSILAQPRDSEDCWLLHSAAARYLGISNSTLYRYAEQEKIESRKLGNRLEYRRSVLDQFKDQSIRPARRSARAQGIIPLAPVSGK
jgi:excisionase family DNA binding protein